MTNILAMFNTLWRNINNSFSSISWRDLWNSFDVGWHGCINFHDVVMRLELGENVCFWLDKWAGTATLKEIYPRLFTVYNQPQIIVVAKIEWMEDTFIWLRNWFVWSDDKFSGWCNSIGLEEGFMVLGSRSGRWFFG